MKMTVKTASGNKDIIIGKTWDKDVCLFCGNPLGKTRFNSASFIGASHKECQPISRLKNMALPNDLKNMKDVDLYFRGSKVLKTA